MKSACFFIVLLCSGAMFAQEKNEFEVRGLIKDQDSAVIPALSLNIGEKSTSTDINGEFRIKLPPGDYQLTASTISQEGFRVFLRITDFTGNPNYLVLSLDSLAIRCGQKNAPKIISSPIPAYPPAARAVRAGGDVAVVVQIGIDGKVLTAKAVSGHPLLRRVSEIAAEKFVFTPGGEAQTVLTFVFMPSEYEKPNLKRYSCPYRILVVDQAEVLQTVNADPGSRTRRSLLGRFKDLFRFL